MQIMATLLVGFTRFTGFATTGLRVHDDVQIIQVQLQSIVNQVSLFNVLDQRFYSNWGEQALPKRVFPSSKRENNTIG